MGRTSIRRRFLVGSIASALTALVLFAIGSFVIVSIDDAEVDMEEGDSFQSEVAELIAGAMAVAAPLALGAAAVTAVVLSRRSARPLEDAIRAARETTAHDLKRELPIPARDDELRDLVVSLNGLFARLDDGFGALGRFGADASHELRTPLAIMATELEVALLNPRSVDEWQQIGRTNLDELRRLSRVVEGLLALARAGVDAPADRTRLHAVACVDAVLLQLGDAAEQAGVTLDGPTETTSDELDGNPVMLETAVRNVVENAIGAVVRGGRVRVQIDDASGDRVAIIVDDDGAGLGSNVDALFLPFHRGSSAPADTRARGAGVGLGLAIARRVAESHGGSLEASRSPLGGARFTFTIPRRVV